MGVGKFGLGLVFALTLSSAGQAATELVTNGGFETGTLAGWSLAGNTGFTGVANVGHTGSFGFFAGPVGSDGVLGQTLATVTGGLYNISFWLRNEAGSPNHFSISFGGAELVGLTNYPLIGFTHFAFDNIAASSMSDVLAFNFRNDPDFWIMDDVSVTAAVPVPASLPLLMAGLAGLGFVARKSRKKAD